MIGAGIFNGSRKIDNEHILFFATRRRDILVTYTDSHLELMRHEPVEKNGTWGYDLQSHFRKMRHVRYPTDFELLLREPEKTSGTDDEAGGRYLFLCGVAVVSCSGEGFTDQVFKSRFTQGKLKSGYEAAEFMYGILNAHESIRHSILQKQGCNLLYHEGDEVMVIQWLAKRSRWFLQHIGCDTTIWKSGTRVICLM